MPVGCCLSRRIYADVAISAWPWISDDWLAPVRGDLIRDDPRNDV
jgi:hypothetical protein